MIIKRLGMINRNQKGSAFTELLIAITIASLIAIAVTMGVFQIVTGHFRTSNHLTAVRQVQEAGYWMSHDIQMSENVTVTGTNGFPLTIALAEWDDINTYQVEYSLITIGGIQSLQREYSINGAVQNSSIIARYIDDSDPTQTSCGVNVDGIIVFTVTATVGSGSQQGTETRVYEITPRPDS